MEKTYTIGEIHRLGLLKNFDGKPYKHEATISRIVTGLKWKERKTKWGIAKTVSASEMAKWNAKN